MKLFLLIAILLAWGWILTGGIDRILTEKERKS